MMPNSLYVNKNTHYPLFYLDIRNFCVNISVLFMVYSRPQDSFVKPLDTSICIPFNKKGHLLDALSTYHLTKLIGIEEDKMIITFLLYYEIYLG